MRQLPNLLTLLNLACGTAAIVLTLEGQWQIAVYLILTSSLFDFLDGFLARALNAQSETGKQLDTLADMVSFGVLPAVFIYTIFKNCFIHQYGGVVYGTPGVQWIFMGSVLVVPALSAIRLARFNVEDTNGQFFHGLPTPAHALFWTGLFWQIMKDGQFFGTSLNIFFLLAIMFIMAFHMILPVPMYSLKFEHYRIKGNLIRYVLIIISAFILLLTGLAGLSLVILTYIVLSLLNLLFLKQ